MKEEYVTSRFFMELNLSIQEIGKDMYTYQTENYYTKARAILE